METTSAPEKPITRRQPSGGQGREEIARLIEQWRQSGKNKTQFCRENGLNYMTFIGWTRPGQKTKKKTSCGRSSSFVPLTLQKSGPGPFAEISLAGSTIALYREVPAQYLRQLLR